MRSCQEIKCFWRTLSCLNIIVTRWNVGARNAILSFAFLLFLWDNASLKHSTPSHFAKCKLLICTLISMQKIKDICFFPVLLLIKEFFNQIEWETQKVTPNQKMVFSGANFSWWLSLCKKNSYCLIFSTDIDD